MHGDGPSSSAAAVQGGSDRADMALQGLYEISKLLATPGRLEAVLSDVLNVLARFVELRRGMIALIDGDGRASAAVGVGWGEGDALTHFPALPQRLIARVLDTRLPVVVADAARDPLCAGWQADPGQSLTMIGAPIEEHGEIVGALIIERPADGRPPNLCDEDARYLTMIGAMVGRTLRLYDIVSRDRERLMEDKRRLEKDAPRSPAPRGEGALSGIVGSSPAIRHVFSQINVVARTHTTLLLRGESGVGKELFARAAHDLSPRRDGPFIRLNCAALAESMLEPELFGHEKGAFTGAVGSSKGRFERADKGTLFLDEIGEISPNFQAKLLRALQEGEFERVGGSQTVKVDVRFVFATNRNLEAAVERGAFRSDLYYRINVVSILLPPLRERPEDVPLLAQEFLRRFNEENGMKKTFAAAALRRLQGCWFPGNVRELENCVRRAAALSSEDAIGDADFACNDDSCLSSTMFRDFRPASSVAKPPASSAIRRSLHDGAGAAPEREKLIGAMEKAGWVQAKAARLLHMTPRQVAYALGKHHIEIKKF